MGTTAVYLLLLGLLASLALPRTASQRTGYVSQGGAQANTTSLVDALKDQTITTIVLTTDYDMGLEFDGKMSPQTSIAVNRNVTISGLPGKPMPLWNLRFQRALVELCASCSFTMKYVAITNERRGNGAAVDIFVGAQGMPGSVVSTFGCIRLRLACTSTASTFELINKGQSRSPRFPLTHGPQRQVLDVVNATFRGVSYENMLLLKDYSYDVPLTFQEGLGSVGGYTLVVRNTTRLCSHILGGDCLSVKSPDACVNELIDQLLAQEAGQGAGQQRATVVVPVVMAVAAVVVIAAIAAGLLWRRRRRRQADATKLSAGSKTVRPESDIEKGTQSLGPGTGGDCAQALFEPLLDTQGWDVTSMNTTSSIGKIEDSRILLGKMVGAGSFGRVYKGRWAGRDVAVKVIEHESTAAVENEVQLMLSIKHSNVVRAYHYITYTSNATDAECKHPSGGALAGSDISKPSSVKGLPSPQQGGLNASPAMMPQPSSAGDSRASASSASLAAHLAAATPSVASSSQLPSGLQDTTVGTSQAVVADVSALKHVLKMSEAQLQQPSGEYEVGRCSTSQQAIAQSAGSQSAGSNMLVTADQAMHQQRLIQQHASAIRPPLPGPSQQQGMQQGMQEGGCTAAGNESAHLWTPAGSSWALDSWPVPGNNPGGPPAGLESLTHSRHTPGGSLREVMRSRTWLVQEFCDCGTLALWVGNALLDPSDNEQLLQLLLLLQDAARGVQHLHSKSIVHGDLNARNVLVKSNPSGGVEAKLADLGISRVIKQHSTHRTTATIGTMSHMPPELLRYGRMSPAVDVYAFGVMMWELYTGQIAFKKLQYGQFFDHVVLRNSRPPIPPHMPEDYSLLLTCCWAIEPSDRPSISAVLDCLKLMILERQQHV